MRVDRDALVSGWDIDGSLRRVVTVGSQLTDEVQDITASAAVDHNLGAMFVRMNDIARKIALISLLVSLPLLLIAGVLLGNLANLLLLNERRQARPAAAARRFRPRDRRDACCLRSGSAGSSAASIGAILGTLVPLTIYFGGVPPLELIPKIQEPLSSRPVPRRRHRDRACDTGWRLVREASRVSPLEASRRVSAARKANP